EENILRAPIGNDQLRVVRDQGNATDVGVGTGAWRGLGWAVQREAVRPEGERIEIEDVDMVGGAEIDEPALLIVEKKFVEAWMRIGLDALQILERGGLGICAGGRSDGDGNVAGASWRGLNGDALQGERIRGIEAE